VGPDRVVQPCGAQGRAIAPFSSGYPVADRAGWPAFLDEVRRRTATCGPTSTRSAASTASRPALRRARPEFMPSRRSSTCTRTRPRPTTSARPLAPTWHPARLDGPRAGHDLGPARAARRARRAL
jgi:hypothetical protein